MDDGSCRSLRRRSPEGPDQTELKLMELMAYFEENLSEADEADDYHLRNMLSVFIDELSGHLGEHEDRIKHGDNRGYSHMKALNDSVIIDFLDYKSTLDEDDVISSDEMLETVKNLMDNYKTAAEKLPPS